MRAIQVRNDALPAPATLSDAERWEIIHALRERVLFLRNTVAQCEASQFDAVRRNAAHTRRNLRDAVAALDVFAQSNLEKEF